MAITIISLFFHLNRFFLLYLIKKKESEFSGQVCVHASLIVESPSLLQLYENFLTSVPQ